MRLFITAGDVQGPGREGRRGARGMWTSSAAVIWWTSSEEESKERCGRAESGQRAVMVAATSHHIRRPHLRALARKGEPHEDVSSLSLASHSAPALLTRADVGDHDEQRNTRRGSRRGTRRGSGSAHGNREGPNLNYLMVPSCRRQHRRRAPPAPGVRSCPHIGVSRDVRRASPRLRPSHLRHMQRAQRPAEALGAAAREAKVCEGTLGSERGGAQRGRGRRRDACTTSGE